MGLTADEVLRLAGLARLDLRDGAAAALAEELTAILARLEALPDPGETPRAGALPGTLVGGTPLRPDDPGTDALARAPSEFAPEWSEGFFTVPRLTSHREGEGA